MNDMMLFNRTEKEKLLSEIASGKLSHAYLIEGGEGCGKTYFARFAAAAVLCTGDKPPCGKCPSCVKALAGSHPDLFYFSPDKKASMGVETVRDIKKSLFFMPNDGDRKVYIIDDAQKMTVQAQNALLKFIEEPPASVLFFIVADKKESLLPTVVSRTRIISLAPSDNADIRRFLMSESKKSGGEQIDEAINMAEGSPGKALKLLCRDFSRQRQLCLDFMPVLVSTSKSDAMAFLLSMKLNRDGVKEFFTLLMTALADVMNARFGRATRLLSRDAAAEYAKSITDRKNAYLFDLATEAVVRAGENANINLLLMTFAAKLK
ncbi:MAG: DNA polymerase III subunit delta' [Ruminococcus sp.]|jgi:DNA polymerase III, delta' subunit|nr:DNA polymerase III subunit delta' [Ruminococcus sp.]MDD7670648.1 DNA polymerase III subunit delta' [Ruminococcus sp.]